MSSPPFPTKCGPRSWSAKADKSPSWPPCPSTPNSTESGSKNAAHRLFFDSWVYPPDPPPPCRSKFSNGRRPFRNRGSGRRLVCPVWRQQADISRNERLGDDRMWPGPYVMFVTNQCGRVVRHSAKGLIPGFSQLRDSFATLADDRQFLRRPVVHKAPQGRWVYLSWVGW